MDMDISYLVVPFLTSTLLYSESDCVSTIVFSIEELQFYEYIQMFKFDLRKTILSTSFPAVNLKISKCITHIYLRKKSLIITLNDPTFCGYL